MTLQKTTDTETFAVSAELSENVQNVGGVLLVAFIRQITQIKCTLYKLSMMCYTCLIKTKQITPIATLVYAAAYLNQGPIIQTNYV